MSDTKIVAPRKCSVSVSRGWPHRSQCMHKATVEREGKLYCGTHDPEKVAARRDDGQEKYERDNALRTAGYELVGIEQEILRAVRAGNQPNAERLARADKKVADCLEAITSRGDKPSKFATDFRR